MDLTEVMMNLALASCENLPDWEVDDRPFHRELDERGHTHTVIPWTAKVDWSQFDAVLIRNLKLCSRPINLDGAETGRCADPVADPIHSRWDLSKTYKCVSSQGRFHCASCWIAKQNYNQLEHVLDQHTEDRWFETNRRCLRESTCDLIDQEQAAEVNSIERRWRDDY